MGDLALLSLAKCSHILVFLLDRAFVLEELSLDNLTIELIKLTHEVTNIQKRITWVLFKFVNCLILHASPELVLLLFLLVHLLFSSFKFIKLFKFQIKSLSLKILSDPRNNLGVGQL